MQKLVVIEYEEGCGYNCQRISDVGSYWASRYPFNRAQTQRMVLGYIKDFPEIEIEQHMIYTPPFETSQDAQYENQM